MSVSCWCVHVVLCVDVVLCVVCCCVLLCVHVVLVKLGTVCPFKTPPCVRSGRLRVYRQQARMSKTFGPVAGTHGDVLTVHTEAFWTDTQGGFHLLFSSLVSLLTCLFLFFFLSFLFSLFSFIFSFIFSFCTHRDEIRQTSDSTN